MGNKDSHLEATSFLTVRGFFKARFQFVLVQLFDSIAAQLQTLDKSQGGCTIQIGTLEYKSPTSVDFPDIFESYNSLLKIISKYVLLLVIQFDDCQDFFCGLTESNENDLDDNAEVPVSKIMQFAFRLFSLQVSELAQTRHILWIFSGTRPNLGLEMKVASKFSNPFDISQYFCDFNVKDISKILSSYFRLGDVSLGLEERFSRLCGPPKLVYFFINSSVCFDLNSISCLCEKWDSIEKNAISIYREQIKGTLNIFGNSVFLENYARNLVLLHTHLFVDCKDGFINFEHLPDSWLPYIEAGLIRVRRYDSGWKLYSPTRFLVKIFSKYVKWFNWENYKLEVIN